jgi:hypothetical protein
LSERVFTKIEDRGEVFAWGEGFSGQLGNGQFIRSTRPQQILDLATRPIVKIAAGEEHSVALTGAKFSFLDVCASFHRTQHRDWCMLLGATGSASWAWGTGSLEMFGVVSCREIRYIDKAGDTEKGREKSVMEMIWARFFFFFSSFDCT